MCALNANTTGGTNVAVGFKSLAVNTTAADNTAVGACALNANTTAFYNTAVGLMLYLQIQQVQIIQQLELLL